MSRLLNLPAELRLQIYKHAVIDPYPIPGDVVLRPRRWVLPSLRRVCKVIHRDLLPEMGKLRELFVRDNIFRYNSPLHLTQVAITAPPIILSWLTIIDIQHHWLRGHRWDFSAADLAWSHMLPNLRHLELSAGSIDGLRGGRRVRWMNTPEATRRYRYRRLIRCFLNQVHHLPSGLILDVHAKFFAIVPGLAAPRWTPRGTVFVTMRYKLLDIGGCAELALEEREDL